MKTKIWQFTLIAGLLILCSSCSKNKNTDLAWQYPESFKVKFENPTDLTRTDELLVLDISELKQMHSDFNPNAFVAFNDKLELPVQTIDSG